MKVLVTGGTGFTGSHTVRALVAAGHEVRLLVRDPAKVRRAFEPHGFVPADIVVGDMTDVGPVDDALAGCDGVVHTAALVDLRRSAARLVEDSNARGVELIIGGAARRGLSSIVHVSSLGVFFVPGGSPLSPELPIAPGTTAYARSKARAEVYVRRLQEQGAPIRISYPAGIVGPDDPGMSAMNNGVYSWVRDAGLITSSGLQVVDVRDLAALHVKLLELPSGVHRYAAAAEMLPWAEVYALLEELTGTRVRRIRVPGRLLRAAGSVGDMVRRVHDFNFPLTRDAMEFMTQWPGADAERTTGELGVSFRDVADTFRDTLVWMYRAGHLTAAQVGKLARSEASVEAATGVRGEKPTDLQGLENSEMRVTDPILPAGTVEFDPFSEVFFNDPFNTYRRLRDEAPVYHNEKYGFWALSRYEDVEPALKDFQTYSSARGITLDMYLADPDPNQIPMIIMMDPPEHTVMRKLVNKVFTPRAVQALEPMIRATITEVANTLNPTAFDVVEDFGALFPVEIITTMLGVPPEDRQQLRLWSDKGLERKPGEFRPSPESVEAFTAGVMFYFDLVQQRRAEPQDDMISRLTQVDVAHDDGVAKLTDIEIAGFALMLGGAGAETVVKLIGNAAVTFAENPSAWQRLRADRSKIPFAVEELLRYEAPTQYQLRYSTRDVTLHGTTIPAHSVVMLINASATRDERAFPNADLFDIDRTPNGHNLSFGYGVHSCLGAALARMEARIALDMMLDLMPEYQLDRAGLRRVAMANVAGWANVPINVTASPAHR